MTGTILTLIGGGLGGSLITLGANAIRNRLQKMECHYIEDDILSSFNDAYHILAESNEKLSHQDLMLCLYGYLKISNNVVAFFMKSMPGTIRQRKNRLKEKLPEKVYLTLFPKVV